MIVLEEFQIVIVVLYVEICDIYLIRVFSILYYKRSLGPDLSKEHPHGIQVHATKVLFQHSFMRYKHVDG